MDSTDTLEERDGGPEVQINFPESVMSRIEELMGDAEQFDSAEFECVSYINRMFPTEQSLAGVDAAVARAGWRLANVQAEMAAALPRAAASRRHQPELRLARTHVHAVAAQVSEILSRAERSEATVREITAEMKQLDCAKRNLTAAITALNHFHMLAGGVAALRDVGARREYRAAAGPLQAARAVLLTCGPTDSASPLDTLARQLDEARLALAAQAYRDIKEAFTAGNKSTVGANVVREACAVLDVLDRPTRDRLVSWMVHTQLQEYEEVFGVSQEAAWISHVEQRFSWLKRQLLSLEGGGGGGGVWGVVPGSWRLSARVARAFCRTTRRHLAALLQARRGELTARLLLEGAGRTRRMELLLHRRYNGLTADEPVDEASIIAAAEAAGATAGADTDAERESDESDETEGFVWLGAIGACFEPHLHLYVDSLDASLRALMDRLLQEARAESVSAAGTAGGVLASCADLFLLYKKCLVQCAQLSTGEPLLQLTGVFEKYLVEYCSGVLMRQLEGEGGGGGVVANLQGLLRDDATPRLTTERIGVIAAVITTAEYCLETTVHLEHKLQQRASGKVRGRVSLAAAQARLDQCLAAGVSALASGAVAAAEPPLAAVSTVGGAGGEHSAYVGQVVATLHELVPRVRTALAASRKYFTQFCIRFASSFIPRFIQQLYRCKPLPARAAEQLLLDTHTLKTALLDLPTVGEMGGSRAPPATYSRVVVRQMSRAEVLLQLVLWEGDLSELAARAASLLPDAAPPDLQRILDMKGLRPTRAQRRALDAVFREHLAREPDLH